MTLARQHHAIERAQTNTADWIPHLTREEVAELAQASHGAAKTGRGERDGLLIQTIFDGCFRVAEAVSLAPNSLHSTQDGWVARIVGKGGRPREAALSTSLVARLHQYAYQHELASDAKFFKCSTTRVFQIVARAFDVAGIPKPPGVGTVHVLRHSGALARLAETGNPTSVQHQLGHSSAKMTLRYFKTLTAQEGVRIQQGVDFKW